MTDDHSFSPPYYAVIFSATVIDGDHGYAKTAARMEALAATMPGYIGFEAARNEDGSGIAVSYWESEEAIATWKRNVEHLEAQARGRADWYANYTVRIARVERAYEMKNKDTEQEK